MKRSCLLHGLLAVGLVLSASTLTAGLKEKIEAEVQKIKDQTGVLVNYVYDRESFFPKEWLEEDVAPEAEQLPLDEVWQVIPLVKKFLAAYPPEVLRTNLTDIYLVTGLNCFGQQYGGTSHISSIYINCREDMPEEFLLARMHSEFSSVLMRKYPFAKEQWEQLNPSQFQYVGSGVAMLGQRNLYGQDRQLLEKGFLVKYSQSSLENDFNMFVDWLFTKRNKLESLARKYPAIRAKKDLAVSFYQAVGCQLAGL